MTKIEHLKFSSKSILASDIPVGTYFRCGGFSKSKENNDRMSNFSFLDCLFLRVYERIINIDDPSYTWSDLNIFVQNYRPVEVSIKEERFI